MATKKKNNKKTVKKTAKKTPVLQLRSRKPAVTKIIEKPFTKKEKVEVIEKAYIRYSYDITKLMTSKDNLILEIFFDYKGTMVIPKSLKNKIEPGNCTVSGSLVLSDEHVKKFSKILLQDYKHLTKKDVLLVLKECIRPGYQQGLKDEIHKQLFPDTKIIEKLSWK